MREELVGFERLIRALAPWRAELVVVGGWAHRMHRRLAWAREPSYAVIRTMDADLAVPSRPRLEGGIAAALQNAGFQEELSGDETPPAAQYHLGADDGGFYAEFLTPLSGSGSRRDGSADATMKIGGVVAQRIRHLEVLLVEPWHVTVGGVESADLPDPVEIRIANPVTFVVQKLLIHERRAPAKQPQDVLYIHDTMQLFAESLDKCAALWQEAVQPALHRNQRTTIVAAAAAMFDRTTDVIREAARIPADRELSPEEVRFVCREGLRRIMEG